MAWNIFRKQKKEEIDPLHDLVVNKMQLGWIVDYDLNNWEVAAVHRYDFGGGDVVKEWELRSGTEIIFLEYENEDGEFYSVSRKIPFGKIEGNIRTHLHSHDNPPEQLTYESETYYLDEDGSGLFFKNEKEPGQEFIFWNYTDGDGKKFITIEQWGASEYETYAGIYAEEFQFSNILPRE
ncbi:DUF4178 domain-containing protein [bacterium]|nr:DUF4178 domain-containing protein [bacterium]